MTLPSVVKWARAAIAVLTIGAVPRPGHAQYPVQVPKAVLERYVGEYLYPWGESVKVRLIGDTLFREIPGQQVPFIPISETMFKLGPVFTAEFVADETGGMTKVLTDGVDVEYRLVRKTQGSAKAAVAAAPPAAVRVPREVLERYVGHYDFIPGQMSRTDLTVTVRLRGDTLTRQISAAQEVVLTPLSETKFRVGRTSLVTEFVIEQNGDVTQLMGAGYQQLRARRTTRP